MESEKGKSPLAVENCRGFVTIATGSDLYDRLAAALLCSYRMQQGRDAPFAIICDQNHDVIKNFDTVVLMEEATGSDWFQQKNAGKYKDDIQFSLNLHGGIYYVQKTDLTSSVFNLAINLSKEYEQYHFRDFVRPADEPVIAMSMAVHG